MTRERFDRIRKRKYAEDRVVYVVYFNYKEVMPLCIVNDDEWIIAYLNLDNVFETKDQAEWALKTVAERTERFEPPMWEDIDGYCFNFVVDNINYRLCVEKENLITVGNGIWNNLFEKYASDVTKENYKKACEIVRDLFKGGK